MFGLHLLDHWKKIGTLKLNNNIQLEWVPIRLATKAAPRSRQRWASRLASRKLPTGMVMEKSGVWPNHNFKIAYVHLTEDTRHMFQSLKGDTMWNKLRAILQERGECYRAVPQIITEIIFGISLWRKGDTTSTTPTPPSTPCCIQIIRKENRYRIDSGTRGSPGQ